MKKYKLAIQYTLFQFLFWTSACANNGFVAIQLQEKGMSNTVIGIMTSVYCAATLFLSPLTAGWATKYKNLSVRRMVMILFVIVSAFYLLMILPGIPLWGLVLIFTVKNTINGAIFALVNALGMEYENAGRPVNFSIARAIGSLGWAVSAMVMGILLETADSDILAWIYVGTVITMLLIMITMEDIGLTQKRRNGTVVTKEKAQKEPGLVHACLKNRNFLLMAFGILLNLIGYNIGTTFAINIMRSVGGEEASAGMSQFVSAGSEVIFMFIFAWMIHKMSSVRVLKISCIMFAIRYLVLYMAGNLGIVMFGYFLQGPSTGLYIPAVVYFVNERFADRHRARGQALFAAFTSTAASLIGSPLGGMLQDMIGVRSTMLVCLIFSMIGSVMVFMTSEKEDLITQ